MHLLAPFIAQNFKKVLGVNPQLRWIIFRPKMAENACKRFFPENILVNLVVFNHVYLPAKNQSLMSLHL